MSKIVRYVRKQLLGFSSLFFRFSLFSNLDKKKKFVFCLKNFLAIFYYYKCYNIKCLLLLFQNICISLLQRKKISDVSISFVIFNFIKMCRQNFIFLSLIKFKLTLSILKSLSLFIPFLIFKTKNLINYAKPHKELSAKNTLNIYILAETNSCNLYYRTQILYITLYTCIYRLL